MHEGFGAEGAAHDPRAHCGMATETQASGKGLRQMAGLHAADLAGQGLLQDIDICMGEAGERHERLQSNRPAVADYALTPRMGAAC
jgi:hypothetical protein